MKECPFCNPFSFENQKIILENEHCMFLQMPQEILIGSGLIIPRKHRETVFDLTEEEWITTYSLLQRAKYLLDEQYAPNGYNVGWNCYPTGGQSIPHAHLHVVPRYEDEPFAGKGIRHWIKSQNNKRSK
ncbi:HIT family protein [Heyndrickxia camelliae]|uniref:HIT family protein n=1 Tax=Heyndrickxia camelliae TaxID=1707093 RepID=A0A2N3LHX5_9BACI|nr:HIT domain-containing protein [Heyndrickxia camelliae]PKR84174.1 HIT family protein [Heyndrickxia camelliae]